MDGRGPAAQARGIAGRRAVVIVLEILLLVLLHLAVLAGLLFIILGLSGNFVLLGLALITAWIGGFEHLSWLVWIVLLALAVLGEVVEALLGVAAARGFGASKWGMFGTFVGGILGAIAGTAWIPLIGSLIGAFVGAFAGAFVAEWFSGRAVRASARAGTGAFLGKVAATGLKMGIGAAIAFFTLKAAYSLAGN